jgi:serine O-acetyltransferase
MVERAVGGLTALNWHAVRLYRVSFWLWQHNRRSLATVVAAVNRILTGVEIPPSAVFGEGLVIMHGGGIVVHWDVQCGRNCTLYQQVTLGSVTTEGRPPRLGDGVTVFPGARVLGDIELGDRVSVTANSVVLEDVPAGTTVAGIPARPIAKRRSAALV